MGEALQRHRATITGASVCAVVAAAAGGYLVGHSSGKDLDAARAKGQAAGRVAGVKHGTERGRSAGAQAGFKSGYEAAYRKAFEDAGLDAPKSVEVPAQ